MIIETFDSDDVYEYEAEIELKQYIKVPIKCHHITLDKRLFETKLNECFAKFILPKPITEKDPLWYCQTRLGHYEGCPNQSVKQWEIFHHSLPEILEMFDDHYKLLTIKDIKPVKKLGFAYYAPPSSWWKTDSSVNADVGRKTLSIKDLKEKAKKLKCILATDFTNSPKMKKHFHLKDVKTSVELKEFILKDEVCDTEDASQESQTTTTEEKEFNVPVSLIKAYGGYLTCKATSFEEAKEKVRNKLETEKFADLKKELHKSINGTQKAAEFYGFGNESGDPEFDLYQWKNIDEWSEYVMKKNGW